MVICDSKISKKNYSPSYFRFSDMSFKNAVALVAGGASGLGLATAQRIVARGGHAVIMDLERSNGREEAAKHANLKFVAGDITSCNDVAGAVEFTKSSFNNRVDLAVQCAGIGTAFMTVSPKMSPEKRTALFKKTIDVNLVGAFNFVTHVAEVMSTQDPRPVNPEDETIDHDSRGVILMTASIAAMDGQRGQSGYSGFRFWFAENCRKVVLGFKKSISGGLTS